MADLETVETPEVDVDAMNDEEFASFKENMGKETPEPEVPAPEPEKALEPGEAEVDEEEDDLADDGKQSDTVPHAKFNRTNERRKAAERERDEIRDKFIRLEARTAALLEAQQPKPEAQEAAPADDIPADDDIVGLAQWAKKQLLAQKQTQEQQATQQREQTEQARQFQTMFDAVNTKYTQAAKSDPTLVEAHQALRKSIGEEMAAMGYSDREIGEQLIAIENQHLAYIHTNNLEVGSYIKRLAGSRGWAPKAAEAAPANPDPVKQVEQREQARQAGMSMGKSGGAAVNIGKIGPQDLLEMSDEDFEAYRNKHGSVAAAFQE